jgi:hypothetical protein
LQTLVANHSTHAVTHIGRSLRWCQDVSALIHVRVKLETVKGRLESAQALCLTLHDVLFSSASPFIVSSADHGRASSCSVCKPAPVKTLATPVSGASNASSRRHCIYLGNNTVLHDKPACRRSALARLSQSASNASIYLGRSPAGITRSRKARMES